MQPNVGFGMVISRKAVCHVLGVGMFCSLRFMGWLVYVLGMAVSHLLLLMYLLINICRAAQLGSPGFEYLLSLIQQVNYVVCILIKAVGHFVIMCMMRAVSLGVHEGLCFGSLPKVGCVCDIRTAAGMLEWDAWQGVCLVNEGQLGCVGFGCKRAACKRQGCGLCKVKGMRVVQHVRVKQVLAAGLCYVMYARVALALRDSSAQADSREQACMAGRSWLACAETDKCESMGGGPRLQGPGGGLLRERNNLQAHEIG